MSQGIGGSTILLLAVPSLTSSDLGPSRWRVYAPRNPSEVLRRDSSPDYSQEDIGEPVLEVILQPGVRARAQSPCILRHALDIAPPAVF